MRLDFNVLWVDDQPDRVASQVTAIAKQMELEGFDFKPRPCVSIDEVEAALASDIFTDEVDLILVDWDLGGGVEGQSAIARIRDRIVYKDVVFYSANTAPERLRQIAFEAGLEGVYCAARDGLVDEVVGVFESLVKKVLDLDHARGIVMGATSDIDHMVNECLIAMHGKLDDEGKKALLKEALDRMAERMKDLTKQIEKLQKATTMQDLFKAHMVLTANDRLRLLIGALETQAFNAHVGAKPSVETYMSKVVPGRNIMGHQVLVPAGKPTQATDATGKAMSLNEIRELRRLILGLRHEFRNLLAAVQGP